MDLVLHLDIIQQILTGAHLLRDQLGGDILQIIDRRFLGDAEGNLIGELIERARGLGALAVQSAHRQTELAEVRADTVDDAGHPERRKMEHHRRAHTRTEVGGTLRQVAETLVEREV